MDPETLPTEPLPITPTPRRPSRARRVLAVAAGVAMVPALYAVATAATGGGGSATVAPASRSADDTGTELDVEHGVTVEKPHGGAATPSVPESTTPSVPEVTTPTTPEQEIEHAVPEPGDDNGDDNGRDAPVSVPSGTQSFSSVGGSITVTVNGSTISLASNSPAAGFGAEVHDNGPTRVEVRFTNGDIEWRIRVELGSGGLTSEITQHG